MKPYAQSGEDDLLMALFAEIGITNCVAVEFGAWDGLLFSNTARFRKEGWRCILFDSVPRSPRVIEAFITRDNVNDIFTAHDVPAAFDLLSIDIDGNDLWVWEAITATPRVVVIEYNPGLGLDVSVTVPYDAARVWDGSTWFGASARALVALGQRKGYELYASTASNLIFVMRDLCPRRLRPSQIVLPPPTRRRDRKQRAFEAYP